ncbi:MAG TPA: YdeI/OmpD-associated family protein [Xanthomonadaceae bacterium]|nr:YdeI/OmpD-associated family protein [Xanthomonadaceae bacterium]
MTSLDPRIDAYIERAAEFARPILAELRERVHKACPDCEEAMKWSMPTFMYRGRILCHMAAFKQHCAFGFWREVSGLDAGTKNEAMGQFGRIGRVGDLPGKRDFAALVKQAMAQMDAPAPRKKAAPRKPPPQVPPALAAALKKHAKARAFFDSLAPGQQREYCEWIAEAKQEATRERRLAQAIEWLGEGKTRHWKYKNC